MLNLFSEEVRRNPYPTYDQLRGMSPVLRVPPPFDAWMLFDYDSVKWALSDHEACSSRVPAPRNWFIFSDPPAHTRLRSLISQAFTPRMIASLEPQIRDLSRSLLDPVMARGAMDLAIDYSVPLPMKVIAGMIGIPLEEWPRYKRWSDTILRLSDARLGGPEAEEAARDFTAVTAEMDEYVGAMVEHRRGNPRDDLFTLLIRAEVDGERLARQDILGFLQLLVVAGQETSSDLINNAVLCLLEHPGQLARLRAAPELLPSTIEEVLRYRSPVQWVLRTPTPRCASAGPSDFSRQLDPAGDRIREPRSAPVSRSGPFRRRTRSESTLGFWSRRSLLLGSGAVSSRGPHSALGSARALRAV